jgi:hypothetical protein
MNVRPRKRDPAFLHMAAVAATGGVLAIAFAIGFPIWTWQHGRPYTPAFSLFAAWGVAALAGAYACVRTYLLSDAPDRPRGGGVRLALVKSADALPARGEAQHREQRAA